VNSFRVVAGPRSAPADVPLDPSQQAPRPGTLAAQQGQTQDDEQDPLQEREEEADDAETEERRPQRQARQAPDRLPEHVETPVALPSVSALRRRRPGSIRGENATVRAGSSVR
jgi:hypothetical protein